MFFNRLRSAVPARPLTTPEPTPAAFVFCPPVASPALCAWQQELYARALAQAQAVVQPSLLERDLLGVWN